MDGLLSKTLWQVAQELTEEYKIVRSYAFPTIRCHCHRHKDQHHYHYHSRDLIKQQQQCDNDDNIIIVTLLFF